MSDKKGNEEAEAEIFNRFSRIVKEKFTSLADAGGNGDAKINQLDVLYKLPEFDAEKRILNELNGMGLKKGVLAGLACFAFLRLSPGAISRALRRRAGMTSSEGTAVNNPFNQFNRSSGYKLDPPSTRQADLPRPGLLFRAVRLALDSFVSVSIGAYASLYFVDKGEMMRQFADIPLVEGRSLMSEELCGEFTSEFQKFDRRTWDANHPSLTGGAVHSNGDGGKDFRNTIQGFVANCRRRAIYEGELRKERGLGGSDPVAVPSPGVPRDISVSLDDLLELAEGGGEDDGMDGMGIGDDYFDTYFDTDNEGQ